ncbi:hypothetical protein BH23BAC1_BH23BAC1_47370 [soil metagenome]
MTLLLIIFAFLLLPVFYNVLIPFKPPVLDNYFTPGQTFESKGEGIKQTVIRQIGNKVYNELVLGPKALGPPEHIHLSFDESATVNKGTLSVYIDGEVKKVRAGERAKIFKGQEHRFYNETEEEVHISSDKEEDGIPVEFAYCLAQLYPYLKKSNKMSVQILMKIAVLDDMFDTYPKGGVIAFKTLKKIIKPYARLLGYTPYDEKSKPLKKTLISEKKTGG